MSESTYEWSLKPEEGWKRVTRFTGADAMPKFVTGRPSEDRIEIRYFFETSSGQVWAHTRFGFYAQGPPGHAHGGSVAAVLDEAMGLTAWETGLPVVAAELSVRYRVPTPLYEEHLVRAWIEKTEGDIVRIGSTIGTSNGTVFARGRGRFVNIGEERFREMADVTEEGEAVHASEPVE